MVTQQNILEARQIAIEREIELGRARATLQQLQTTSGSITRQVVAGSPEAFRRRREQLRETIATAGPAIARGEREVQLFRERIGTTETQLQESQALQKDIELAEAFAGRPELIEQLPTERARRFARQEAERRAGREELVGQLAALKAEGLEPQFVSGQLAGFIGGPPGEEMSFRLEELGIVQPSAVAPLQEAGIISVERIAAPAEIDRSAFLGIPTLGEEEFQRFITGPAFQDQEIIQPVAPEITTSQFFGPAARGIETLRGTRPVQIAEELFFGRAGERLVGFGTTKIPKPIPDITLRQTRTFLEERPGTIGFPLRVAGELLPTTPAGVSLVAATPIAFARAAPALRTLGGFGIGGVSTVGIVQPGLTIEQRTAVGLVGGLGFAGGVAEVSPFIKGGVARILPGFRKVKTEEIFGKPVEIIRDIPLRTGEIPGRVVGLKGEFDVSLPTTLDIALIPAGKGLGRTGPAFIRGAFGFSEREQAQFLGKPTTVITSARDLFGPLRSEVKIQPSEGGLGLFGTPADPITGIPQARISRLGIPSLADFLKAPDIEAPISFVRPQPQFVVFRDVGVTRAGAPGTFKAFGFPGGELEVTALGGIRKIGGLGKTTIKGGRVDIIEAELIKPPTRLRSELEAFRRGDLTPREVLKLQKGLTKQTGISTELISTRFVSPTGLVSGAISPGVLTGFQRPPLAPRRTPSPISRPQPIAPRRITPPTRIITEITGISPPPRVPRPPSRPPISPPVSPPTIITFPPIRPPTPPPIIPGFRLDPIGRLPTKKRKGRVKPLAPSFTATALRLFGKFPKAGRVGILPGQVRVLPKSGVLPSERKRRRKPKKKR